MLYNCDLCWGGGWTLDRTFQLDIELPRDQETQSQDQKYIYIYSTYVINSNQT